MTRAQKSHARDRIVQSFVDAFRKKLKADPGWDIGAAIEREKRAEYRGAMAAAERIIYAELREQTNKNGQRPFRTNCPYQ